MKHTSLCIKDGSQITAFRPCNCNQLSKTIRLLGNQVISAASAEGPWTPLQ